MLPCNDWYTRKMASELDTYMRENGIQSVPYSEQMKLEIEQYKNIMRDEKHPMRLHLMSYGYVLATCTLP